MDWQLSDEQTAIADLAADIFAGDGDAPPAWAVLADAGLPTLLLPEDKGSAGLGMVELALVLIGEGRGLLAGPLWRHALAAAALGEVRADARLTLAVSGDVTATQGDGGWTLDGAAYAVPGLEEATQIVLAATTPEGERLFAVDLAGQGQTRCDGTFTDNSAASDIAFVDAPARLLDHDGEWLRARAAVCLAALTIGVARGANDRTAAYVGTRQQFGRPIGSFQAVAQRLADSFTDVEVAQTLAMELAWFIDAGRPLEHRVETTTHWANQCAHRVAHAAMHLHGGVGADVSFPIHRVLLLCRGLEMQLGGAHRQLAIIGKELAA